jgi:predicted ATP-binding protein involved in virulence
MFEISAGVTAEGITVVRIESFRVVNYKSFADSEEIRLEPGFNVIVGRNNVGKTALAEARRLPAVVVYITEGASG